MTSAGDDALLVAVYQAALGVAAILYGVLGVVYSLFVNLLQQRTEEDPLPKHAVLVAFRRVCRGTSLLLLLTTGVAALCLWSLSTASATPLAIGGALVIVAFLAALGACYLSFFTML
jgi:hypothetical protein